MPVTSGKGRLLNGSGGDRVKRNNLSEFRGSAWEAVNDWFFGVNTVDYDWRDTADKDRLTKWVYTQDGSAVSDANVVAGNKLDIGLTTGPNPSSNQRDLFTIPETGPWGIAHALVKIQSEAFAYSQSILPQHGFGLRAQEDTVRRTIAVWHDVFVGNPEVINIGVWQGNLDGSGFVNRGGNATFSLKQTYNITAGSRSGGVVTGTCSGHGMETGDWLNIDWTREFPGVSVSRSSNVVTCTPGSGHGFQAGDQVAMGLSSPASFDGTFTITSVNSTQVFWNQTGSNESGTGKLKDQASNVTQVEVTVVDTNTFQYTDGKHDLTSLGVSNGNNARYFPYFMEVKVAGSMAYVRCWGRHQSIPSWTEPLHAFNVDLDKAHITYTVTASERTSNVATLTIGAHDFQLGSRIDVDITDASFDTTNGYVTGITATTVSYPNTGANDTDGGTGTCKLQGGSALASQLVDIPTPKGSGRIALVANHEGIDAKTHCVYGDIIGTNSFESEFTTVGTVVEIERPQPVTAIRTWHGAGTGSFGFAGTSSGVVRVNGAGSGSFGGLFTSAGVGVATGVATGSLGFTGTATGAARALGVAAGSFGFTGSATGNPTVVGSAAGTFGFTGASEGRPVVQGAATGLLGFTATAGGVARVLAAAAGTFGFTGSALGAPRLSGAGLGSYGFTGTAVGVTRSLGAATAALGFTGSATGNPRVTGAGAGTFGFTATGDGHPTVTGTASGLPGFSGTAAGVRTSLGSGTALLGFAGAGTGVPTVPGAGEAAFGFTATAAGVPRPQGAAIGQFGFAGTASGDVTGSSAVEGSATGLLGYTATATGVPRVQGVAAGSFGFTATAAGTPRATGTGIGDLGFTGTAAGVSAALGAGTGSFGYVAAVVGVRRPQGAGSGLYGFTATASGIAKVGATAAADFGFAGLASGTDNPGVVGLPGYVSRAAPLVANRTLSGPHAQIDSHAAEEVTLR